MKARSNLITSANLQESIGIQPRGRSSAYESPSLSFSPEYRHFYLEKTHKAMLEIQKGDYDKAILLFEECADKLVNSQEAEEPLAFYSTVCYINIVACFDRMGEIEKQIEYLQKASESIQYFKFLNKDHFKLLYLRLMCNFIVCYIQANNPENIEETLKLLREFIEAEKVAQKRQRYFAWILSILFDTQTIAFFPNEIQTNRDAKSTIDGLILMLTAHKFELSQAFDRASETYFQCLEFWQAKDDCFFIISTLDNLLELYQNVPDVFQQLSDLRQQTVDRWLTTDSNIEEAYQTLSARLTIVKALGEQLQDIELQIQTNDGFNQQELSSSHEFAILAIKIAIRRSINKAKSPLNSTPIQSNYQGKQPGLNEKLLTTTSNPQEPPYISALMRPDPKRRDMFLSSTQNIPNTPTSTSKSTKVSQILKTDSNIPLDMMDKFDAILELLENKQSHQIVVHLLEHPFVLQACKAVAFHTETICNVLSRFECRKSWNLFKEVIYPHINQPLNQSVIRQEVSQIKTITKTTVISKTDQSLMTPWKSASAYIASGSTVIKINSKNKQKMRKYMVLIQGKVLRYADKFSYLKMARLCRNIILAEVRGITYGKCTDRLAAKKNHKLEPWLCFSLISNQRSFDFYVPEGNINYWYFGLAAALKACNPGAAVLSPGKFLWRKMILLMRSAVYRKMSEETITEMPREMSASKVTTLFYYHYSKQASPNHSIVKKSNA